VTLPTRLGLQRLPPGTAEGGEDLIVEVQHPARLEVPARILIFAWRDEVFVAAEADTEQVRQAHRQ
jgi:hypothetical protein